MSFVTTARLSFGNSFLLSRSTSAVFPDPTGPAIPTRNALTRIPFPIVHTPVYLSPTTNPALPLRQTKAHHKQCPQVSARNATRQAFSHEIFNRRQSKNQNEWGCGAPRPYERRRASGHREWQRTMRLECSVFRPGWTLKRMLHHLAVSRPGQRRDEMKCFRNLELGHPRSQKRRKIARRIFR